MRIVERDKGQVVADHAWTWCGSERCLESDNLQDGSPVTKRYFAQGFMAGATGYYTVTDPLGSVRQVIDAEGKVQAEYDYTPWGYRFQEAGDGSVTSDIGFAGYFHHASSGYDFALYRAYDSMHRRWLNRDPVGEEGGLNLYAYVNGNPTSYVDREGAFPEPLEVATGFVAGAIGGYVAGGTSGAIIGGLAGALTAAALSPLLSQQAGAAAYTIFQAQVIRGFIANVVGQAIVNAQCHGDDPVHSVAHVNYPVAAAVGLGGGIFGTTASVGGATSFTSEAFGETAGGLIERQLAEGGVTQRK